MATNLLDIFNYQLPLINTILSETIGSIIEHDKILFLNKISDNKIMDEHLDYICCTGHIDFIKKFINILSDKKYIQILCGYENTDCLEYILSDCELYKLIKTDDLKQDLIISFEMRSRKILLYIAHIENF